MSVDQTQSVETMVIENDSSQMILRELNRYDSLAVNAAWIALNGHDLNWLGSIGVNGLE